MYSDFIMGNSRAFGLSVIYEREKYCFCIFFSCDEQYNGHNISIQAYTPNTSVRMISLYNQYLETI